MEGLSASSHMATKATRIWPPNLALAEMPLFLWWRSLERSSQEAHEAKARENEKGLPDGIGQVGPKQQADAQREKHEQAAHGRRTGLGRMRRHILMNVLTAFQTAQPGDEARPDEDGKQQSRDQGRHGTEGDVTEDVEQRPFRSERARKL